MRKAEFINRKNAGKKYLLNAPDVYVTPYNSGKVKPNPDKDYSGVRRCGIFKRKSTKGIALSEAATVVLGVH